MSLLTAGDAALPDWRPLAQHVTPAECADFMWMYRDGDVHFYKHIITRRYLMLDGAGNCLRWNKSELRTVDFESEYLRVTGRE